MATKTKHRRARPAALRWLPVAFLIAATILVGPGPGVQAQPPPRRRAAAPATPVAPVVPVAVVYHGNLKTRRFHRPRCRYYNCKHCTAVFRGRRAAIKAGFIPCKVCRP